MPIPTSTIQQYLDSLLRIRDVPDDANAVNGLQVENSGTVTSLIAAVDASQATIDQVAAGLSDRRPLLLVHHGLFWDGNIPVTGRRYRRLRALLLHDIALYSAHIPLDMHPEYGNNVSLARMLGVDIEGWYAVHRGIPIGIYGSLALGRDALVAQLNASLGANAVLIPGGPDFVSRIGIITGGAGNMIAAARDAGLDTFITGEGAHHTYFDAMEWGINVIFAGHYATEKLGVQRLAAHLAEKFSLPWEFHDHDTGL
ncbi:MAG: Nif3-like dinuclear metal center hexameric protein [Gemmatimonadota bacterium]